jgi:putative transposase
LFAKGFESSPKVRVRYGCRRIIHFGRAERWVGTCKRELIDHVVVLGEGHLRRLLRDYVIYVTYITYVIYIIYITYDNADRVHTRLADSPDGRPVEARPSFNAKLAGLPRVGGLHHRYVWQEAA